MQVRFQPQTDGGSGRAFAGMSEAPAASSTPPVRASFAGEDDGEEGGEELWSAEQDKALQVEGRLRIMGALCSCCFWATGSPLQRVSTGNAGD